MAARALSAHALRDRALLVLAVAMTLLAGLGAYDVADAAQLHAASAQLDTIRRIGADDAAAGASLTDTSNFLAAYLDAVQLPARPSTREPVLADYQRALANLNANLSRLGEDTAATPALAGRARDTIAAARAWEAWAEARRAQAEADRTDATNPQADAQGATLVQTFQVTDRAFVSSIDAQQADAQQVADQRNRQHSNVLLGVLVSEALVLRSSAWASSSTSSGPSAG
ncbi:MAG TPA: hypothetical protein VF134_09490 [Candidatus Dormibacteraeota bacterium]